MTPIWIAAAVFAWIWAAESLHGRRVARVRHLAHGPLDGSRRWTRWVPLFRSVACGGLAWSLVTLLQLDARVSRPRLVPEGGYQHLVIALDVSPSMQLKDAGPARDRTRAQRASDVLLSVLERIVLEQVRVSVVAFYTGAKPVVVDTYDLEVVKNILNDLPLDYAFEIGKTTLIDGIREAFALARPWNPGSTTLLIASDGDTVPDTGIPERPRSVQGVIVLGLGDTATGRFIDGHQSRQDVATLRQLAGRLKGSYYNVNDKHLPSTELFDLAQTLPMKDAAGAGARTWALAILAGAAGLLAALPVALAAAGSSWHVPRQKSET
jgi:Ca-activated chloride channel family protein